MMEKSLFLIKIKLLCYHQTAPTEMAPWNYMAGMNAAVTADQNYLPK